MDVDSYTSLCSAEVHFHIDGYLLLPRTNVRAHTLTPFVPSIFLPPACFFSLTSSTFEHVIYISFETSASSAGHHQYMPIPSLATGISVRYPNRVWSSISAMRAANSFRSRSGRFTFGGNVLEKGMVTKPARYQAAFEYKVNPHNEIHKPVMEQDWPSTGAGTIDL